MFVLAVSLALLLLPSCHSGDQKHQLHFSYITTITGGIRAIGGKPVVDLALEEINNRSDLLQNYTLNYTTILNSECTRTGALDSFFKDFPYTSERPNQTTTHLALLCCGCSPATIPVAEISHYWNIPQVAFAVADNKLTDRSRFKNLFRTLPSFEFIATSLAELVRQFGWRQMAVVSQDESLFTGVTSLLSEIFTTENWILDKSALIESNEEYFITEGLFPFTTAFSWMKRDFRVIYINAYAEYAFMILCKAHELGLLPPRYVWITPMWYNKEWWKPISDKISFACTESELLEVLHGSIGVVPDGYFVTENYTAATFSGRTPRSFIEEYKRRLSLPQYAGLEELGIAGVAYDTIWAIALGLDRASIRVAQGNDSGCNGLMGELVPLEEFDYLNQKMGCVLKQSLEETNFAGITGPILYNSVGSRPDNLYLVQQYRKEVNNLTFEREIVAEILVGDISNYFMFRNSEKETTLWEMGVPYDGSVVEVIHGNSIILVGIYCALAFIGLLLVLACLLFNIIFRKKKVVKLSSPNLNYLIIVGAALLYVCVFLFVAPATTQTATTVLCNLRLWIFSVGYTLCFAVILSKTWRVYYIFNNPTTKKKSIKDWLLLVMVAVTVAVDMVILLIGTAIPNSRLKGVRVEDKEQFKHVTDDGINEEYYVYVCSVGDSVIWLGFSFAYKGLLQIIAMFMAFHTRKVKIKALNDSKATAAIIYINSIVLVLMIVNIFVLEAYHNLYAALSGLALLIQASLFLGLLFIPKMLSLYKDPSGTKIFSTCNPNGIPSQKARSASMDTDCNEKIKALTDRIKTLEATLALKQGEESCAHVNGESFQSNGYA